MLKYNFILMTIIFMQMKMMKPMWWQTTSMYMMLSLYMMMSSMYYNSTIFSPISMTDSMSSCLMCLSIFITALMLLTSTKILLKKNMNQMFILLCSILLLALINAFSSSNLFMFYIWFETSLIPTMMIILLWGYQPERLQASMYMMIYMITASLPMFMLFTLIYIYPHSPLIILTNYKIPLNSYMSIMLIMGFLVKLPMFMFHLWLPKAHVEAPIAGSMILAAILLKLGSYGICRMIMLYEKIIMWSPMLMTISLYGAVSTSMICIRQSDLKSLIAYSSVSHMGLMVTGTLSYSTWGMNGTLMMMIAHGLCSSAMFTLANINYERTNTRSLYLMKGMLSIMPTMSMWWFMFIAMNMATPPSINLMSEILLINASTSFSSIYIILLIPMILLTSTYSLLMYTNTQHGTMMNFSNPMYNINQNNNMVLMLHLFPLIMFIMSNEFLLYS